MCAFSQSASGKGPKGNPLTQNDLAQYQTQMRRAADIGRMGAGLTSLLLKQDVNASILTGTTAVENNFMEVPLAVLEHKEDPKKTEELREKLVPIRNKVNELLNEPNVEDSSSQVVKREALNEIGRWHEAREKPMTPLNTARVIGSYGLDGLSYAHDTLDKVSLGLLSKVEDVVDKTARVGGGLAGRGVRELTGNAHAGQNVKDSFILLGSVYGGKGLGNLSKIKQVGKLVPKVVEKKPSLPSKVRAKDPSLGAMPKTGTPALNPMNRNAAPTPKKGSGAPQTNQGPPPVKAKVVSGVKVDYSIPEAAYSLPIDPLTRKGPMSIDSRLFTSGKPTPKGGIRNQEQFWPLWEEKYPGALSEKNLQRIQNIRAPKVDSHWIEHFPEHQRYMGQTLEHHHIDQGPLATPLPKELHRMGGNYKKWHD